MTTERKTEKVSGHQIRAAAMLPGSPIAAFAESSKEVLRAYKASLEVLQGVMEICEPYTDEVRAGKLVAEISAFIQSRTPDIRLTPKPTHPAKEG
jgi:hypothetical protein